MNPAGDVRLWRPGARATTLRPEDYINRLREKPCHPQHRAKNLTAARPPRGNAAARLPGQRGSTVLAAAVTRRTWSCACSSAPAWYPGRTCSPPGAARPPGLVPNPVVPVEHDGRRWLVAPYGPVSWVHNARAAGRVSLTRRRDTQEYAICEVSPEEAGPILRRYIRTAPATRRYFQATTDSAAEDFVAEAACHPVFELTPVAPDRRTGRSALCR